MLSEILPSILKNACPNPENCPIPDIAVPAQSNVTDTLPLDKHVVLIHGENDQTDKFKGFDDTEWTEVVKKNLSKKLHDVPIKKSVHTKDGKGCLILPDAASAAKVRSALQEKYNVEVTSKSNAKTGSLLPKMCIVDIDVTLYNKENKQQLLDDIRLKNHEIDQTLLINEKSELSVVFINEDHKCAVLKMTPDIRSIILKNRNRIYLNLTSHFTRDHIHLTKCGTCNQFGHKSESKFCSGQPICKYCAKHHKSDECPSQNDPSLHACSNCLSCPDLKDQAYTHNSSASSCPYALNYAEKLMKRTAGYKSSDFQKYLQRINLK